MPKILISAGEPSGDLYAGALASALKRLDPTVEVVGLGGERLVAGGGRLAANYRGLAVTGLLEAVSVLPRSFVMLRRLVDLARRERPDVFVPIDFPDFNFRLARALKRLGIPIVYYVSPQLWAWRPRRLKTLTQLVDLILVIFPFEEEIYVRAGVPVEFVGHPLVDLAHPTQSREVFLRRLDLQPSAPTIALLPGSRSNEVRAILPRLARAAPLIANRIPTVQFVIARAPNLDQTLFKSIRRVSQPVAVVESRTDDVLAAADVVVTASGTATVQTALHEKPMVIVYRLSPLTYRIGKRFVQVDTYGMVNLVAGETVVPELIQAQFTPEAVAAETVSFLTDPVRARRTQEALRRVRTRFGPPGASTRAAEAVLRVVVQRQAEPVTAGHPGGGLSGGAGL